MTGARRTADTATAEVSHALADGRRRARAVSGPYAVLAMQRAAGNAAVSALIAARLRSPGDKAVGEIDAALREVRRTNRRSTPSSRG